jgi:hypothetical protein
MRRCLPAWTPLVIIVALLAAWPVASLASGGDPQPAWVHAAEGDPVPTGDPVNAAAGEVAAELADVGVSSVGLETAPWRGTERATDNPISTSSGSKIKLVYVYGADQPDRFGQYASLIQTDAKAIAETVAATSGGRKTLRFDTGTDGGAGYLDIASVRLPQALAVYKSMSAAARSAAVRDAVASTVRVGGGVAHYAVYADGLYGNDWVSGIAQMYFDPSKSASNLNNRDGLWAFVWGDGSPTFSSSHRTTLLHEITHTLGGVQPSAPNGTTYGHCSDAKDVMCYDDGGLKAGQRVVQSCTTVQYDCDGEDYFNAAPAPGSYLASNWNVYDSAFLCAPASCVAGGPVNIAPEPPIDEGGAPPAQAPPPAAGTSTTATPPPTSGSSATRRKKARSRADRAVEDLLAAGRRALRRGVPSRLKLSFSSPSTGRLRVRLSVGSVRAASLSKRMRAGRTRVVLRVDRRARRSFSRGHKASLSVSFAPSHGRSASAHAAVSSRRR